MFNYTYSFMRPFALPLTVVALIYESFSYKSAKYFVIGEHSKNLSKGVKSAVFEAYFLTLTKTRHRYQVQKKLYPEIYGCYVDRYNQIKLYNYIRRKLENSDSTTFIVISNDNEKVLMGKNNFLYLHRHLNLYSFSCINIS